AYDIGYGSGGWGNNELQYYTQENATVANGELVITARKDANGFYTSSRLKTQGKHSWTYGKIAARLRMPKGQGMWPAFWMLGDNITSVGWPRCGEIDIVEMVGGGEDRDDSYYGTLHWDAFGNHASTGTGRHELPDPQILNDNYHVFEIEWNQTSLTWKIDGMPYGTSSINTAQWPTMTAFHNKFFIILNLAVGGNWPGYPNTSTEFPQTLRVDWVRVYSAAPPMNYSTWAASRALPHGKAATTDDADADGLSNLLEYALGSDPLVAEAVQIPAHGKVAMGGADYPTISFTRNLNVPDVLLTVEVSNTLPFGSNLGSSEVSVVDWGNGLFRYTHRSNVSLAQEPVQFLRVRAELR
ncbi:MAG: glycoside hydrolase family 16 protein, partial [Candidatus Didemnitutus sp.]|nr:glycoside hydrolase family 16 protein [Candidatus Didemnitutus sp.]